MRFPGFTVAILWMACGETALVPEDVSVATPPREEPSTEPPARIHFHDASARLGEPSTGGRGVALIDIDQDRWPDAAVTHSAGLRLLRGVGDGLFLPWAELALLEARGVTFADVDSDSDLDVYLTSGEPAHALYRNDGGSFVDVTEPSGLGITFPYGGEQATFGDLDRDGDLDLFLAFGAPPFAVLPPDAELFNTGAPERLYLNDGHGRFTQRPDAVLEGTKGGETFQGCMFDADRDGDLDIFSVHDSKPDQMFVNEGNGFFTDESVRTLPSNGTEGTSIMGVSLGDFDQDGEIDVFGTQRFGDSLYKGFALKEPYTDIFERSIDGYNGTLQLNGWGAELADLDDDGDLDLIRTANFDTGTEEEPAVRPGYTLVMEHRMREGDHRLVDVTGESGLVLELALDGWGLATADIDRDGDVDVLVGVNGTGPHIEPGTVIHPQLLLNDGTEATRNRSISIRIRQPGTPNVFAVGSTVDFYGQGLRNVRVVQAGQSYLSHCDDAFHIGLGTYEALPAVRVTWPDGTRTTWLALSAGDHVLERPSDPATQCCAPGGCFPGTNAEDCLKAQAFALGLDGQCAVTCGSWEGCCPGMSQDHCLALCALFPAPREVLECMATAPCEKMVACGDEGRLIPGAGAPIAVGQLCPPM